MLRRGPDPLELAAVLRRLERLRSSEPTKAPGWVPAVPTAEPSFSATPTTASSVASRIRLGAFDPGRRGVAVLAVAALVAAAAGAWYFFRAAPHVESATDA